MRVESIRKQPRRRRWKILCGKSGVFFLFSGRIAGNLIAFRFPDGYNMNKGKEDAYAEKDAGL